MHFISLFVFLAVSITKVSPSKVMPPHVLTSNPYRQVFAQTNSSTHSTTPSMVQLSADPDFHFEILRCLTSAPYGGSDVGETLTAAAQTKPGDFESFYSAFFNLANRLYAHAQRIDPGRFPVSAREAMFRTATFFRSADFYLHGNWSDPRINSLWAQQAAAFDIGLALLPVPGKRVTIQACGFQVPAIWYSGGIEAKRRPTIILGGGYDGGQEEVFHQMGRAAVDRGWNVITYEGPGQSEPRRYQNLGFILEWEHVVTPVVDWLHSRPDVDTDKIALVGLSFGGLLAPRAAAFEHRLAAVIALDGLYEFGPLFLEKFPTNLTTLYKAGDKTAFDTAVNAVRSNPASSTQLRWTIDQGLWAFNIPSPFDWMTTLQAYTLNEVVDKIRCPAFVADAEDDLFFKGQGAILASKLGHNATYYQFMTADGAGGHAGIGAMVLQSQVVYDWFQNLIDSKN